MRRAPPAHKAPADTAPGHVIPKPGRSCPMPGCEIHGYDARPPRRLKKGKRDPKQGSAK